jgi:hypothetical protein
MKKILIFYLTFISAIVFFTEKLSAQSLCASLDSLYREEIIFSTDRDLYLNGENIWFQAVCVANKPEMESLLSKILYVEMYSASGQIIYSGKYLMHNQITSGYISIPENINSENYYLRAYTQYMRNFSPATFANLSITIINPDKFFASSQSQELIFASEYEFLPVNHPSNMALFVNPKLQKSIEKISLWESFSQKEELITIAQNGLASVEINAQENSDFSIKIYHKNGKIEQQNLPKPSKNVFLLKTSADKYSIKCKLENSVAKKEKYILKVKSLQFNDLYTTKIELGEEIELPLACAENEVFYFQVTDLNNKTVFFSARSFFAKEKKSLKINNLNTYYTPRTKVDLSIENEQNLSASLAWLSVTKCQTISEKNEIPIELVYNPHLLANYFKTHIFDDDFSQNQLNSLLILYQKFYQQTDFLAKAEKRNSEFWLPEMRDVSISGKILDKNTQKPLSNEKVYATVFGKNEQVHLCKTDGNGDFSFNLNHLSSNQNVSISVQSADSLQKEVLIQNDFCKNFMFSPEIPLFVESLNTSFLEDLYFNAQIFKSYSPFVALQESNAVFQPATSLLFPVRVELKDFIKIPVMREIFDEITPFVSTQKVKDGFILNIYNEKEGLVYKEPLVMVDFVPVFNTNSILALKPEEISQIEVNNQTQYLGNFEIKGCVNIRTKTKQLGGIKFPQQTVFLNFKGYQPEVKAKFNSYFTAKELENRLPDFRNLLYFGSFSKMPENFSFYTSDSEGFYSMKFLFFDGKKIKEIEHFFEVKKNIP